MINNNKLHYAKQLFILLLSVLFVGAMMLVTVSKRTDVRPYDSVMEENKLSIVGLKMVYVIDNSSYVNLLSEKAYVDIVQKSVDMTNVNLQYIAKETQVDARADNGVYEMERMFRAYGNLSGNMNDMQFVTRPEGVLIYDYQTGRGDVTNGIQMLYGMNTIDAERAEFDTGNNFILFSDNVSVDYYLTMK